MRYRWHVIVVACLAQSAWLASAVDISRVLRRTASSPSPISVAPSQYWDGDDGPWSTFAIRVGTPAQDVRVLISTAGQVTWTVLPQACVNESSSCMNSRGLTFNPNNSSSWHSQGYYSLTIERNLDYIGDGEFGNDTLTLGGGSPLQNQVIGGIEAQDFYLGMFGVNPRPTNFTNGGEGQASYISTLKAQNLIPSVSFGYTAGNRYRLNNGVFGSLTLGGYDQSRFTPNPLSFTFASDNYRDIVVGIQSISSTAQNGQSLDLLPIGGILAYVDSTVPYIWLPLEACQAFESAFGLTYDEEMELYPVNATTHSKLLARNASITFTLGISQSGGQAINITIPYGSFDLQVTWPEANTTSSYFPLRRAANESQYTLGRTFLQEVYLTVDWERGNFSISQCLFDDAVLNNKKQLVAIQPANGTSSNSSSISGGKSSSPSSGEIAGIVVAVIIVIGLLVGGLAIFWIRQRKKNHGAASESTRPEKKDAAEQNRNEHSKGELPTGHEHERYEMRGSDGPRQDSVSKSPLAAWVRSEKPRDFDGGIQLIGIKDDNPGMPQLPSGPGAMLQPVHEMESPSLRAVELDATELPKQLYGSEASLVSEHPSPPFRSATQSPIPRSSGPSPISQPSASPPTMHSIARPALNSRTSTMNSLPSSRYSLHSPNLPAAAVSLPNRSSSVSSPISPLGGAELDRGLGISSVLGGVYRAPGSEGHHGHEAGDVSTEAHGALQ